MSIFHQIIPDVQTAGMAWSRHNRNDSEYLHPFGRKQQAVFCQCHHRNPTRNVKISEQKNCSEIKKMVPLTGLEPVLCNLRQILSLLCLPFHHSGICIPQKRGMESWRDVLEGCSETEIIKFEKVGCLQALFGLGAASGPRDFKSRVSTYSTTAA